MANEPAAPVSTPSAGTAPAEASPGASPASTAPGATPPAPEPSLVTGTPAEPPTPEAPKPAEASAPFDLAKLTLPEGLKADDPAVVEFGKIFSDEKLSPQAKAEALLAQGQKLINDHQKIVTENWTNTRNEWVSQVKADPEIGGPNLERTLSSISKAIDTLGPQDAKAFRDAVDFCGLGDNPAFIRGLSKWAKALTEGSPIAGAPPTQPPSLAETWFPSMEKKA